MKKIVGDWSTQVLEMIQNGKGHKFLIVMCDTFSYEDYPVYLDTRKEVDEYLKEHNYKNMQSLVEVIEL